MTQIVDKKLKLMCDCCKSHFDKPCAWLSLGNEYCTEIMEIQKELEEKDKEIERLKAREQECIDKYLAESKYRSEIEDKYVLAKYVIDELEKLIDSYELGKYNYEIPVFILKDKLKGLKEGKLNE